MYTARHRDNLLYNTPKTMIHLITTFFKSLSRMVASGQRREEKVKYLASYIYYCTKYVLSWKIFHIPLHTETVDGNALQFFHYSIFLSLYEDMYLNDEYYVKLPKNPTIIDLGSEVGISLGYFKTVCPNSTVLAFEPDPESFKLLKRNSHINRWSRTTVYNLAVSNRKGVIPFYIDAQVPGSLTMSLYKGRQQKKIEVAVDRLSRYVTRRVHLLKMDIEGAEIDVMADLVQSKKIKYIDTFIIEFHHHIDPSINNLSLILSYLEKSGFGYQIKAKLSSPFVKGTYQDFLIFAYKE